MSGTVTIGKVRLVDEYVSDQIDTIEQEQAAVAARVTAVEQTVATLDSVALSNRVTTAEQDIGALETEDAALASATTALSNRVTTAEQDIDALEEEDGVLAIATTALSNRVTTAEQDIVALETQDNVLADAVSNRMNAAEANLSNALARLTEIETHYADTRKTFNIRNHVANKYLDQGGNLGATKNSTNAHYSIEFD